MIGVGCSWTASVQQPERVAVVGERQRAGEQFVSENAQRIGVGRRRELGSERLLGSHVGRGAEHLSGPRGLGVGIADHLGDAVVGNLDRAVRGEQQVLRLDVAVENARLVRVLQRSARGEDDPARRLRRDALGGESLPDGSALQQLHDEEAHAFVFDIVVDRHDVRMLERRQQAGLADEPAPHRGVGGERTRELLDRHRSVELPVGTPPTRRPNRPARSPCRSRNPARQRRAALRRQRPSIRLLWRLARWARRHRQVIGGPWAECTLPTLAVAESPRVRDPAD